MLPQEIVRRTIEFDSPPRLCFCQHGIEDVPDDICECAELDRAHRGWFYGAGEDDWGCHWAVTEKENMGQVVGHPLADWSKLSSFVPPNPRDPFYFERVEEEISKHNGRYVAAMSMFFLFERLHMLHGFAETLADFYNEPEKIERVLDMIVEFKLELFAELDRRFHGRIHGLYTSDDWGTQQNTIIRGKMFDDFFAKRYRTVIDAVHGYGWHFLLHSCGKVNGLVPNLLDAGVDVLNLMQPRTCGIEELGSQYAGKVCFLTMADIQATMPTCDLDKINADVRDLTRHWATPRGGLLITTCGPPQAIGTTAESMATMFRAFRDSGCYQAE